MWFTPKQSNFLASLSSTTTLKHLARFREGLFSFGGLACVWQTGERLAPFAIPLSSLLLHRGIHLSQNQLGLRDVSSILFPPSIPNTLIADDRLLTMMSRAASPLLSARPYHHTQLCVFAQLTPVAVPASSTWLRSVCTMQRSGVRGATAKANRRTHPCDL